MGIQKQVYFPLVLLIISLLFPVQTNAGDTLVKTPRDYEGPFYPIVRQADEDNDLIQITGHKNTAKGDILHLSGRVVDINGNPFTGVFVEIWQTDPNGRYRDKRDTSPGERDPDFQYWGLAMTGADGSFSFTTLVPGAYEPRPAHIHFKVWVKRKLRLTSQIYFRSAETLSLNQTGRGTDHPLQTVDLNQTAAGEYEAYFQIVL